MTGGLMQLVAYGAQDVYLTGNPQITFFKIVYRRYSNFSIETIENVFTSNVKFDGELTSTLTKSGDLVSKISLGFTLTASSGIDSLVTSVTMSDGNPINKIINTSNMIYENDDTSYTYQSINNGLGFNGKSNQIKITLGSGSLSPLLKAGDILEFTNGVDASSSWFEISDILNSSEFHVTSESTSIFGSYDSVDFSMKFYKNNEVGYIRDVGYAVIDYVKLLIGGTTIDKQYGLWMTIWDELTMDNNLREGINRLIGNSGTSRVNSDGTLELMIPLKFFCCKNYGLAIPMIALYYHDITIEVNIQDDKTKLRSDNSDFDMDISDAILLVDYIFLNTEERKRFAQASHEYLIEQVQQMNSIALVPDIVNKYTLYFDHPCKELIWITKTSTNQHCDFTDLVDSSILYLNGQERFEEQKGKYFNSLHPFQFHTKTPTKGIYVYSFAINPEHHQPSGTCNFSRIDSIELDITSKSSIAPTNTVRVFTTNYNVLRILSGMGGVAFTN
jgi:hypothetical protein